MNNKEGGVWVKASEKKFPKFKKPVHVRYWSSSDKQGTEFKAVAYLHRNGKWYEQNGEPLLSYAFIEWLDENNIKEESKITDEEIEAMAEKYAQRNGQTTLNK